MNPLSSSSLNTERARVDAARSAPSPQNAAAEGAEGGALGSAGFSALLRSAQGAPETSPTSASNPQAELSASRPTQAMTQPGPSPAMPADARSRGAEPQARVSSSPSPSTSTSETASSDEEDVASPSDEQDTAAGDTLAHWLLNQGAYVADPAQVAVGRSGAVPPPQNAATGTDDLKAAALAREVLDAVRSKAKAAGHAAQARMTKADGEAQAASADATQRGAGALHGHRGFFDDALAASSSVGETALSAASADAQRETSSMRLDEQVQAPSRDRWDGNVALPVSGTVQTAFALPAGAAGGAVERPIDTPVTHEGFGEAVGVTISQLVRDGVHEARLQLNPAELGPVSVHIAMNGQEARIELGAAHAQTRALLDASLPALTEAFRADGLVLAASQVSDWQDPRSASGSLGGQGGMSGGGQSQAGSQSGSPAADSPRGGWAARQADAGVPDVLMPVPTAWPGRSLGGLDLYA